MKRNQLKALNAYKNAAKSTRTFAASTRSVSGEGIKA
jgi:hypothetical protein